MTDLIAKLPKIRGKYRQNAKLKSWFDVGGNAEILFKPADSDDLGHFLQNCSKEIPITILGAASNVIIQDGGVKGVVIRLGREFAKIKYHAGIVEAGAAALCGNLAIFSQEQEVTALEFLSGIPGAIGGAIAMNAGCYQSDISQILLSVKAFDYDGKIHILQASDFEFSYRHNALADKYIFIEAKFKVQKSTKDEVSRNIKELCKNREKSQPIRAKTGGSTFKNPSYSDPNQKKAWQLIDEIGFRGKKIGDAKFCQKHCNFMINEGSAKASDLIKLAKDAQNKVKSDLGIDLAMEIKILGQEK